jgi:subtilisin family serine protease
MVSKIRNQSLTRNFKNKTLALSFVMVLSVYSITIMVNPFQFIHAQDTIVNDSTNNILNSTTVQQPQVNYSRIFILLKPEAADESSALSDDTSTITSNIEESLATADINAEEVSSDRQSGTFVLEIEPTDPNAEASFASSLDADIVDTSSLNETEKQELATFLRAKETIIQDNPSVEAVSPEIEYELIEPTNPNAEASFASSLDADIVNTSSLNVTQIQTLPSGIDRADADFDPIRAGDGQNDVIADIAILDSGVNKHLDLNLASEPGSQRTFVTKPIPNNIPRDAKDYCGHGTHVAGTAAAKDNDIGVVGSAPGARIWNLKVLELKLEPNPYKRCTSLNTDTIRALIYVANNADKIDVANLSLGGRCVIGNLSCDDPAYEAAVRRAVDAGVIVIVAAGNEGMSSSEFIPARFEPAITVSAVTDSDGKCGAQGPDIMREDGIYKDDSLALFSNYGPPIDLAAPGVNINSTSKDGSYVTKSGTSMAAPTVAGVAASYIAINRETDPRPSDILNALLALSSTAKTECDGNGRGYFTGDPDAFPEAMLYAANINQTGASTLTEMANTTSSGTNMTG